MPEGLDIDRTSPLRGTAPTYAEHVVFPTGHNDWPSKTEDDSQLGMLRLARSMLGPKSRFDNPYHRLLSSASSSSVIPEPATVTTSTETLEGLKSEYGSAALFPSFKLVPRIPITNSGVTAFIKAFLLPVLTPADEGRSSSTQQDDLFRDASQQSAFPDVQDIGDITVLICGHGNRDQRCGILGPILQEEFKDKLARQNIPTVKQYRAKGNPSSLSDNEKSAHVSMISHIGGHKFAGNVIIYIPPSAEDHPLAGKGVWYGRVAPRHVEGIVSQTILQGKIIKELYRGGINQYGQALRIDS